MAELITFGETPLRLSPPANRRLEMAREATIYADGTASNVAVAADELGTEALWLSKLPDNPLGRRVVTQLEEQGIDTAVVWDKDASMRQGLLFRESGAPPREPNQWHDRANTAAASAEPGDFPVDALQESSVVFTGLSMGVLSEQAASTTEALLRASGGGGAVTAADLDYSSGLASPERYREVLHSVSDELDILIASEDAVSAVLDRSGKPRELANIIAADHGLDIMVITRSDHGALALHDTPGTNVIHERDGIEMEAVDPSGQHGAFIGAFLQQLIDGADPARALSSAVATAALARTLPGPFVTTVEDEIEPLVDRVVEESS
jgi:2-dehydro-3-deoxygluconokinase